MSSFAEVFRDKGINLTNSRKAIFEVLENSDTHLTVAEIYEQSKLLDKHIGLATIYRTLNMLCELGLVEKHEFENHDAIYEKADADAKHHHHIINVETGDLAEFVNDEIDELLREIAKKYGFKMLGHKIEIYGEKL